MEEKIRKMVEEEGLDINDLTQEEIEELKIEIKAKENGAQFLDGVLWYARRRIRTKKAREEFETLVRESKKNGKFK